VPLPKIAKRTSAIVRMSFAQPRLRLLVHVRRLRELPGPESPPNPGSPHDTTIIAAKAFRRLAKPALER